MTQSLRTVALSLAGLGLAVTLAGCGAALTAPAAAPTAVPTAPPEVPAVFRPLTATPSPTADIHATIAAAIQATRAAEPTATATPEPTATAIPPTATAVPPTVTPIPPSAKPAPKPPAATATPAINPAERAYVAAWDAVKAELDESMTRAREGGVRTGNGPADQIIGRSTRWKEYKHWREIAERVKALAAPPRLQAAHALRVQAIDHLVAASTSLDQLELATGGMADSLNAHAHNNLVKFRELIGKATAESKKAGW